MSHTLVRSVDATSEPVTTREVMTHLRLDVSNAEPTPLAPDVALASPATPGNVDAGLHRYRITFVTADGETDGGTISAGVTVVTPGVNGRVTMTNIPLGGGAVTSRRVWRTLAGGSVFYLLTTLADNTTTGYTDNTADASLGAACPSSNTTLDPELYRMIRTSRDAVENYIKRALIQQTWQQRLTAFPDSGDPLVLWRPNLMAVSLIQYLDENAALQTLSSAVYEVESASLPPNIWEKVGQVWPTTYEERHDTVRVDFTAGYGTSRASVPDAIRQAILIHVGDLYAHRESFITGTIVAALPFTSRNLLAAYRWTEVR